MRIGTFIALSGASTLLAGSNALAAYLGVGLTHETHVAGGVARSVYRVYAVFDDPNDYLLGGSGTNEHPLSIYTINNNGTPSTATFFNPGGSFGNTAPSTPGSATYWGTYVTIGISDITQGTGGTPSSPADETVLSPGFPNFISGSQLTNGDMSWFSKGPVEQGRAGHWPKNFFFNAYSGGGFNGYGVQLAQITVNLAQSLYGEFNVTVMSNGDVFTDNCVQITTLLSPPWQEPGDVTGDLVVNVDDLIAVLNAWGPCDCSCPAACDADIEPNCVVDIDDLLQVINNWD